MKVPVTNETDKVIYVGPYAIQPGDTREVECSYLDGYQADHTAGADDSPKSIVQMLLEGSYSDLLAHLPSLAAEDLESLAEAEESGAAREEVLSAITQERLTRSSAAPIFQPTSPEDLLAKPVKEIVDVLKLMTHQELLDLEALEAAGGSPRKTLMDALSKEIAEKATD